MKVISMKICPYVQQVRVLLEAKDVSYEVEHIESDNRPDWLMEASPDGGEVPVIITDEGQSLFQSDSIMDYIDEVYGDPMVKGKPLAKAQDKALARLASDNYLVQCATQRSSDEGELNAGLEDLNPIFQYMEKQLGDGPYFHGTQLTMVDISWIPMLHRTAVIKKYSGYDFLSAYPKMLQWRDHLMKTGLADKSVPQDFEKIFTNFYLDQETLLGRLKNK